jgi:glycosyltransferase involved in cell wall biosynthesis
MSQENSSRKILIISHDKIGTKMAGPGIRYHYMAEFLSKDFDVTIGFFDPNYLPDESFDRTYRTSSIDAYEFEVGFSEFDIIISLWLSDSMMNYCNQKNKVVVFDIYAPVPVENLAVQLFSHNSISKAVDYEYESSLVMYQKFLENGDLFLYSNERQRDFWMGYIFGSLQVTPSLYNKRPMYERFIPAPMGIDTGIVLDKKETVLRGVVGNISTSDTVLLWTGGIWDWFDAVTLIEAMAMLKTRGRDDIKLVFLGTQHPNASIPKMAEVSRARDASIKHNLTDDTVYFLDGWVDYHKRVEYLTEADIAVYAHKPSIETEFSHRTRVLDHFLASLPTIGTRGDYLGDIIEKDDLGLMVEPGNIEMMAEAIVKCSEKSTLKKLRDNVSVARPDYDWVRTLSPLRDYLLTNPQKIERLPSRTTPLSKKYMSKIKRYIPKPIKHTLKRGIRVIKNS